MHKQGITRFYTDTVVLESNETCICVLMHQQHSACQSTAEANEMHTSAACVCAPPCAGPGFDVLEFPQAEKQKRVGRSKGG